MKMEMRKILTTTDIQTFQKYSQDYFEKLIKEDEVDFIKYLQQ